MSAFSYRTVQFVPDPYSGARVPVAALVSDGEAVRVVRSAQLPGAQCLGGPRRAALVRMVMEALHDVSGFDRLPHSVGARAILDGAREVPVSDLDAAERWVRDHILPNPEKVGREEPASTRAPNRATLGRRFLESCGVSEYVHATFRPESDFGGRLTRLSAYGEISHWVAGSDSLLLMEPIVPRRAQFREDVREITRVFGSYRFALGESTPEANLARFAAYLLPGGSDEQKADVVARLPAAHFVVDTENDVQRRDFIALVRDLGRTAERQQRVDAES